MSTPEHTLERTAEKVEVFSQVQVPRTVEADDALPVTDRQETYTLLISPTGGISMRDFTVERKFRSLAEQWYLDTLFTSSYYEKILHPAYQKILTLGQNAIPLILHELKAMPNDWFWALRVLTDADPVTADQAGDMQAMADAWITWGRDKGFI